MKQQAQFFLCICFFILLFSTKAFAQDLILNGHISNEKGEDVSYVNVFCIKENLGTHTNEKGEFELKLKPGSYELRIHSIDYQTQIIQVQIKESSKNSLQIVLKPQVYELSEFKVKANQENTADYIMRKAIASAPYYKRQILAYQAKVYLKGTGKVDKVPYLLKSTLKEQNIIEGHTMLTESFNELSFSQPATYKEKVIAIKSSFNSKDGPQPMSMIKGNWYNTNSTELISPLSPQAFSVYKFELLGTFYDEGREVNKIKIIPKRSGRDLYKGTVYIIEGLWCLHSVDVKYESNLLEVSTKIRFEPLNGYDYVWLPQTYDFSISGSIFGVEGSFRYLASISNYKIKLNPNLNHSYYNGQSKTQNSAKYQQEEKTDYLNTIKLSKRQKEINELLRKEKLSKYEMLKLTSKMKAEADLLKNNPNIIDSSELQIDSMATSLDSNFWNENRPIVLLEAETKSYQLFSEKKSDSTKAGSKKNLYDYFIFGDSLLSSNKKFYFNFESPLTGFGLNAIDGWNYGFRFSFGTNKKNLKNVSIRNQFVIPFERKAVYGNMQLDYCQKPFSFRHFRIEAGSKILDFNGFGAGQFVDPFYLLFYKRNMVKMYQEDYVKLVYSECIYRGLNIEANLFLANRSTLEINPRMKSDIGFNSEYTLNNPELDMKGLPAEFVNNRTFNVNVLLTYKPFQNYRIKDGIRTEYYNSKPLFILKFNKAIPHIAGAVNDFTKIEFAIHQKAKPFHWLGADYRLKLGKIFSANSIYFPDYFMHAGNLSWILTDEFSDRFMNLGYYEYSVQSQYASLNLNLNFKRLLILRLPILNLTKIKENIYFNSVHIPEREFYYELGYGLSNISQIIDLGVFSGFKGNSYQSTTFRIGISIPAFVRK